MASSSVSQESLDTEDFEFNARKNRVRIMPMARARGTASHTASHIKTAEPDNLDSLAQVQSRSSLYTTYNNEDNSSNVEQGSPTRSSCVRGKEKRILRPNYLHPKKSAKDKRKLREKRRSTGVVHLQGPSNESTGDSLDDEEEIETRRNTSHNEVIDDDNPQTPEEVRSSGAYNRNVNNKSPSDLEADFEDNQDYDSTVSHSETNLTVIGQTSISIHNEYEKNNSPSSHITKRSHLHNKCEENVRPLSYPSRTPDINSAPLSSLSIQAHGLTRLRTYDIGESASHTNSSHSRDFSKDTNLVNRNLDLEKQIQTERHLCRKLQEDVKILEQKLENKDLKIVQLEKEINLLRTVSIFIY